MIEKNKCPCCKYIYEIIWDDDMTEYYSDSVECEDVFDEELYPEYCPFCGIHREYGGEDDGDHEDY